MARHNVSIGIVTMENKVTLLVTVAAAAVQGSRPCVGTASTEPNRPSGFPSPGDSSPSDHAGT